MIIGKKLQMNQIFKEDNKVYPITYIQILPNKLITNNQTKTLLVEHKTNTNKPQKKLLEDNKMNKGIVITNVNNKDFIRSDGEIDWDVLTIGTKVQINGKSKGKGFAGSIKRHNFRRGPKTHGSDHHRATGSIGSAYPQRVVSGKKMPGHLGNHKTTIKRTQIVEIDQKNNLIAVKGSVPGANKSLVSLSIAK